MLDSVYNWIFHTLNLFVKVTLSMQRIDIPWPALLPNPNPNPLVITSSRGYLIAQDFKHGQ